ncbi:hypothetical protein DNI29_15155 [Hymenobacter sediminis]|uniref:hypothetical protein n=1 Tax=Hymenobacter sediminis TaxID=2218621 RepID=UPI000DA68719|nr:hypothetical protein [Hymenobacter sediminis]RPD46335.1 hypothetical protein DNI29_15155 [Hymenobacter sediminis]
MSTQKSSQPGAPAHKHITFTPANETSQGGDDSASSAYNEPSAGGSQNKSAKADQSKQQSPSGQQSWLDQQQWLKNIDVQQIKDLGTKAIGQVNKMSPTQKVIGGALLAGGLSWLALRSKSSSAKGETYRAYRGSSADSKNDSSSSSSKWNSSNDSVYRGATRSYGEDDYAADL